MNKKKLKTRKVKEAEKWLKELKDKVWEEIVPTIKNLGPITPALEQKLQEIRYKCVQYITDLQTEN